QRKRADARHDQAVAAAKRLGIARDLSASAHPLERLLHRAAVAHPVVDDGDARPVAHTSVPFVLGTPCSVGSSATAARSARASALNAASIMWWALVPASTPTCKVRLALVATARKNSSASSWSKLPIDPGASEASNTHSPRPEMSIAQVARDSSMGTVASPKRLIPERSPSARSSACPMHMPTSSTV